MFSRGIYPGEIGRRSEGDPGAGGLSWSEGVYRELHNSPHLGIGVRDPQGSIGIHRDFYGTCHNIFPKTRFPANPCNIN